MYTNLTSSINNDINDIAQSSINNVDEQDDEDELMTPQELISRLERAWLNEKYSPVLLSHETELIMATFELLDDIEKRLKSNDTNKLTFRWLMHQTEYNRLYYILCSYIRIRCQKLEDYSSAYVHEQEKLSTEEYVYAQTYLNNVKAHLRKSVLNELKSEQTNISLSEQTLLNQLLPKPNSDEFVFFQNGTQDVNGLLLDSARNRSEIIDLKSTEQYLMQFKHIDKLLEQHQIQLI